MNGAGAVSIARVRVDAIDVRTAAVTVVDAGLERRHLGVHLCNAYVLALASRDRGYAALLGRGDLNLADGAPVAWFARRAGLDASHRPSGAELVEEVARLGVSVGLRHHLYGATPHVVGAMADALRRRHPGIRIVGVHSPAFGPVTDTQVDELVTAVEGSGAQVVWVGLGTPKQDDLVDRLRGRVDAACVPVGAAFDFLAGSTRRAPAWMRRAGLEWVFRLAVDPRRLWRRYLWGNVTFLWALVRTGRVLPGGGGRGA